MFQNYLNCRKKLFVTYLIANIIPGPSGQVQEGSSWPVSERTHHSQVSQMGYLYHHHHVPSSARGLEAMTHHSVLCSAIRTASLYNKPVHSVMFEHHVTLGRPRALDPSNRPSSSIRINTG